MKPLSRLKQTAKKLTGYVDLDSSTLRPAARRLQAKYAQDDYSTEWFETTANGVAYDISVHEANMDKTAEKVRVALSDHADRGLAVTVSESGESYERPYTLFIPPTSVERTTRLIGAEVTRIHNNREKMRA